LLFLLASCTENELIRQIEFLQAENRMLRKRVPKKRIFLSDEDKKKLMDLGRAIGPALKDLITIVTYRTYRRWVHDAECGQPRPKKKMGRPKTKKEVRKLILKFARETGWGYTRIMGELKKLGIKPPTRATVRNILKANGFDPGPKRGKGTWSEFLDLHADTLWQCDFFSKRIVTALGLRQVFILAFLHLGTRRVFVTSATRKPDAAWMKQQTEAFLEHAKEEGLSAEVVMRDRDSKFENGFDEVVKDGGAKIVKTAHRAPNQNAYVERWIQSIQQEVLDHFIVFGEDHLDYLVSEYVEYYHRERPHQSLDNELIVKLPDEKPPDRNGDPVQCRTRLGGLLKHYYREAA
jgi:putative transposase